MANDNINSEQKWLNMLRTKAEGGSNVWHAIWIEQKRNYLITFAPSNSPSDGDENQLQTIAHQHQGTPEMHRGREAEKSMFWREKQLRTSLRWLQSMTRQSEGKSQLQTIVFSKARSTRGSRPANIIEISIKLETRTNSKINSKQRLLNTIGRQTHKPNNGERACFPLHRSSRESSYEVRSSSKASRWRKGAQL